MIDCAPLIPLSLTKISGADMTTTPTSTEITCLLVAWSDGDRGALEQLAPLVQAELRRLAKSYLRKEFAAHTLQTTALINEAYLRMIEWKGLKLENRAHFFGLAAQLMRRILVDQARQHRAHKRGGDALKLTLDEAIDVAVERDVDLIALDDALDGLAKIYPRKSQIVEMRFFGGLSTDEIAAVLKISPRTVMREWSLAQAWLYRELQPHEKSAGGKDDGR
jgi:RNA polymerase sigma factor (TIGR02999 family)